ncbi:MAG: glycerol-3-phosphate responsive antiterminator [Bacillota bacterium]
MESGRRRGMLAISPVVVAVRDLAELPRALATSHETIFLLSTNLNTVTGAVEQVKRSGRQVFVHIDLVDGLGKDGPALQWIAETVRPTGILTTRAPLISRARNQGLITVQRIFLIDSQSVHTGLQLAREAKPDFLEVLPGIIPETTRQLVREAPCPIIAGGLCTTPAHYHAARQAGAVAISTSSHALWDYRTEKEVAKLRS